jgi:hypothetical protein
MTAVYGWSIAIMTTDRTYDIRALNDELRTTLQGGKILLTAGVSNLRPEAVEALVAKLRAYDRFEKDNDPYGEHDFGAFDHEGQRIFWKIDYYDPSMRFHSDDPADRSKTLRVLTVMLAEEY